MPKQLDVRLLRNGSLISRDCESTLTDVKGPNCRPSVRTRIVQCPVADSIRMQVLTFKFVPICGKRQFTVQSMPIQNKTSSGNAQRLGIGPFAIENIFEITIQKRLDPLIDRTSVIVK